MMMIHLRMNPGSARSIVGIFYVDPIFKQEVNIRFRHTVFLSCGGNLVVAYLV